MPLRRYIADNARVALTLPSMHDWNLHGIAALRLFQLGGQPSAIRAFYDIFIICAHKVNIDLSCNSCVIAGWRIAPLKHFSTALRASRHVSRQIRRQGARSRQRCLFPVA
jgi:hypothetical protein